MLENEHDTENDSVLQCERPDEKTEREGFEFLNGVPPEETFRVAQDHLEEIFGYVRNSDGTRRPILDRNGDVLLDKYGREACLLVLARTEYIAIELKKALGDTEILNEGSDVAVSDETVEKVRQLIINLSPLAKGIPEEILANYGESSQAVRAYQNQQVVGYGYPAGTNMYLYPKWDEMFAYKKQPGDDSDEVGYYYRDTDPQAFEAVGHTPQETNFYHRLSTHVLLAPLFAEELTTRMNIVIGQANLTGEELPAKAFGYLRQEDGMYRNIDVNRMKVRMLLHDIGRWATHHQDLHESLPDLIAHSLGIEPPLIQFEFNHEYRYFSKDDSLVNPQNIPIEETIFHFIDFIAKRSNENDLESDEIRSLDQLVEHAISRAAGYNGALKRYLDSIQGRTVSVQEKVREALNALQKSPDSRMAQFCQREIMFLEQVIPFLGDRDRPGLLGSVGYSLSDFVEVAQEKFSDELDSFNLYAYNRETDPDKVVSILRSVRNAICGEQN